jgi:tetratricopeptide (TPR) repeat protein
MKVNGTFVFIYLMVYFIGCTASLQISADFGMIENHISAGEYDQAETLCNQIIAENPNDATGYYYLGLINAHREKFRHAKDFLEKSISLDPKPEAYKELARVNLKLKRLNSALLNLNELEKLEGRLEHYADILGRVLSAKGSSDSLYEIGMEDYRTNYFNDAAKNLEKAYVLNEENVNAEYFMHMAKGLSYYHRKGEDNYWEAIVQFGEAAVVNPSRGEPHYLMGICYEKKDPDDFNTPIQEYQKSLELEMADNYREKAEQRLSNLKARKKKLDAFWGRDK